MNKVYLDKKYKTPFGFFDKVVLENEPTLRMVLTGKCNLNCEFCIYRKGAENKSEVESDNIIDFEYSDELMEIFKHMKENHEYITIHLTGGEPTMCKDLKNICLKIKENGFKINIVTNLINIDAIKELYDLKCIDELTFSYIPIDKNPELRKEKIKGYKTIDNERNAFIKKNALMLRKNYDAHLKVNIVCSGLTDIDDAVKFVHWAWENKISPRMQRDRSSDRIEGSTNAVKEILKRLDAKKEHLTVRVPGATEICNYVDSKGNKIKVKIFNQNFRFQKACEKCPKKDMCTKAISSIRVFNKKIGPVLCFCNAKDAPYTILTKKDIKNHPLLKEVLGYKTDKKSYFDKFCINPKHQ